MGKKPSKRQQRRMARASAAGEGEDNQYDQEVFSTERGRRSSELRQRGRSLSAAGDIHGAHALFVASAELFALDDPGAAAASAFYDLGESFKEISLDRSVEDLLEAERFLRLSIASPARQRATLRLASGHDALGQTLRRQAQLLASWQERARLMGEAVSELERACEIAESCGVIGLEAAAQYHHNRGLALRQQDRIPEAISAYRTGLRLFERANEARLANKTSIRSHIRMSLATALFVRGRSTDPDEALWLMKLVLDDGAPEHDATAHILAARVLVAKGPDHREAAERHISMIALDGLSLDHHETYVDLLVELGELQKAAAVARGAVLQALGGRNQAMADHVADRHAENAQRFAVREARVHTARGCPIEAFLALENASGLRYYEAVKQYLWPTDNAVVRALIERKRVADGVAIWLEDAAARQAVVPPEHQFHALIQAIEALANLERASTESAFEAAFAEQMGAALRRARNHPSPVAAIRAEARRFFEDGVSLNRAMMAADPAFRHAVRALDVDCSADDLRSLLEENPGSVLLRVHLADQLLAAAVWLGGDGLEGACTSSPVPARIGDLLRLEHIDAEDLPEVGPLLESLDLSSVLPPRAPRRQVFVLPSTLAARIPWAVAGPIGSTLLDRFDAIAYLPVLTPLLGRQPARPPRAGTTTFLPGDALDEPTRFHAAACSTPLDGETRLWDEQADIDAAHEAARKSDIVVFYTHGRHGDWDGGIRLVGGTLTPAGLSTEWAGCERVELWACQTGVNIPTDWLTPPFVDEAFGIDIAFHRVGVRSTIGTLWSVPDAITAYIVRWYRHELASGCNAPTALTRAQRRWRDELIPKVRQRLESGELSTLVDDVAAELGIDSHELGLDLEPSGTNSLPEVWQQLLDRLTHPKSWAGYRFVGVCDRRPTERWTEESQRPPTVEELAQVERILRDTTREELPQDPGEVLEAKLVEARGLADGATPTPEQAIQVARLYHDRWLCSHRHNLLRGLAWLHEAIAVSDLDMRTRRYLELEAAWLWLELARGELTHEGLRPLYPVPPVLLTRTEALLSPYADDPQARIISMWIRVLRAGVVSKAGSSDHPRGGLAWSVALELSAASYEGLRAREAALSLATLDPELSAQEASELLLTLATDVEPGARVLEEAFVVQRLFVIATELASRFGLPPTLPLGSARSHREIARHLQLASQQTTTGSPADQRAFDHALEHDIGALEGAFWGYPEDDRTAFWMSSGSPGLAWHRAIGSYCAAKLQHGMHEAAIHTIASIQMGADLRIGVFHAWARFSSALSEDFPTPRARAWGRELLLQQLEDAALLIEPEPSRASPYRLDPFRLPGTRLLELSEDEVPLGLTGYLMGEVPRMWSRPARAERTATFALERLLVDFDTSIGTLWPKLAKSLREELPTSADSQMVQRLLSCLDPRPTLRELEGHIRSIPSGLVLLGVFVGPTGELLMASVSRRGKVLHQRVLAGQPPHGLQAARVLAGIVGWCQGDHLELEQSAPSRSAMLDGLRQILEESLQQVLSPHADAEQPCSLLVLAPGPLRGTPWGALRALGRPLRETFSSISLLPQVGFGRSKALFPGSKGEPHLVCVLGVEDDDPGAAAILTLRRLRPVAASAEPRGPITSPTIVEVDVIEAHAPRTTDLRLYGNRSYMTMNATTEGLELRGGRAYTTRNMAATVLPCCGGVELWAATGSLGEARAIQAADRDAMPSLVRAFLQAGAAGVLDLAWPVPKLVKALVCEAFGLQRACGETSGARALNEALLETGRLLLQWRRENSAGRDVRAAFSWLDDARRRRVGGLGGDPDLVVSLPIPTVADETNVTEFIATWTDEIHLAAFRWWGS